MKTLCVMIKAPVMGQVKTRLARQIGPATAICAYRAITAIMLRRLGRDTRWRLVLAIAPGVAKATRAFPAHIPRISQCKGDLGSRMQNAIETWSAQGPVLIMGSDIPGIAPHHVARAFQSLAAHDAVFGPAPDGGYWLVGLGRRRRRRPFRRVRWSTEHALSDTLANLKDARIAIVDKLADIDTADDWREWTRQPPSTRLKGG